jgi:hypothetical protein
MSKTLTGILELGIAIGLQFIPGLGTVAGIALGVSFAATGILTLVSETPKPTRSDTALRSPIPPRMSGYCLMGRAPHTIR